MRSSSEALALMLGVAMWIMPACSGNTDSADGSEVIEVAAPIESVEIEKVAAKEPNATLIVVSAVPSGCESFGHYNLTYEEETFRVEVVNLRQADPDLQCAAIFGTVTHRIPLPDDSVEACSTYTVEVNSEFHSVAASCPAVESGS